jgi:hypothetical protein
LWAVSPTITTIWTPIWHTGTQQSAIDVTAEDVLTDNPRVPIALQWMFPTPLAILIFLAPESPWWLTRKGRYEDAAKAVGRLGNKTKIQANNESVAMMRRTIDLEKDLSNPSLLELWKGVDRYRTLIVCGVYAAQNLTGNLIANRKIIPFPSLWQNTTLTQSQRLSISSNVRCSYQRRSR